MSFPEYPEWLHTGPTSPYFHDKNEDLYSMNEEELLRELHCLESYMDELGGKKYWAAKTRADLIKEHFQGDYEH